MTTIVRYRPDNFTIRPAAPADLPQIHALVKALAEYENLAAECTATMEDLGQWLFAEKKAETLLGVSDGDAVGFAVYFTTFSTFLGKPGIHLEDLFVAPKARGNGYGKAFLARLAAIASERGCGRLEWNCLDWNMPAAAFYASVGATPLDEWTTHRLTGEALQKLALTANRF